MHYRTIFALLLLATATFFHCEKEPTGVDEGQSTTGRVLGNLQGTVQDSQTGTRLTHIKIEYMFRGEVKTAWTDSSGYFYIAGLTSGVFLFTFSGPDDYAVSKTTITIPTELQIVGENAENQNHEYSLAKTVILYQKNAGIKGVVYARDGKGYLSPAPRVKVIAMVQRPITNERTITLDSLDTVEPSVFETTTNERGEYLFDRNLPCVLNYRVYSLPFTLANIDYTTGSMDPVQTYVPGYGYTIISQPNVAVQPNVTVTAPQINAVETASKAKILKSPFNQTGFSVMSNIVIEFSTAMDPSSFQIQLTSSSYSQPQCAFASTWSTDSLRLTIDPYDPLVYGSSYSLGLEGKTAQQAYFQASGQFSTESLIPARLVSSPFGKTDISVDQYFQFAFSKAMNRTSFRVTLSMPNWPYTEYSCELIWRSDSLLVVNPYNNLAYNTTYRMTLQGYAIDQNSFSTDGQFSTKQMNVAQLLDSPFGKSNIPVGQNLRFEFSKPLNPQNIEVVLRRDNSWGQELYFTEQWSDSNTVLTIDPYVLLRYSTTYYMEFKGLSQEDSSVVYYGTFSTETETPPEQMILIYTNLMITDGYFTTEFPVHNSITLAYSLPININADNTLIQLQKLSNLTYVEIYQTVSDDMKTITIDPLDDLTPDTRYRLKYTVTAESGASLNETIEFKTAPVP